ncbi:hypothetical protein HK099_001213 [Clydaea vesicula]|uniref:Secreted protein n=1 Tax=Clydaea vesicula TaxID=447962 RepID=A0AAD5U5D6_9FUNG|nr:hypothetical protein HK099_001213 [Clydaea vesicula]
MKFNQSILLFSLIFATSAHDHSMCLTDKQNPSCEFHAKACPEEKKSLNLPYCSETNTTIKIPTLAETQKGITDTCNQMPDMADCSLPDTNLLEKYSRLCIDMSTMSTCDLWNTMCSSLGKKTTFCGEKEVNATSGSTGATNAVAEATASISASSGPTATAAATSGDFPLPIFTVLLASLLSFAFI